MTSDVKSMNEIWSDALCYIKDALDPRVYQTHWAQSKLIMLDSGNKEITIAVPNEQSKYGVERNSRYIDNGLYVAIGEIGPYKVEVIVAQPSETPRKQGRQPATAQIPANPQTYQEPTPTPSRPLNGRSKDWRKVKTLADEQINKRNGSKMEPTKVIYKASSNGHANGRNDAMKESDTVGFKRKESELIDVNGWLKVEHYAIRFWLPILGATTFSLYLAIKSIKDQSIGITRGKKRAEPNISDFMAASGIGHRETFKNSIETLEDFGLLVITENQPNIGKPKYSYDVNDFYIFDKLKFNELVTDTKARAAHDKWLRSGKMADAGFNYEAWNNYRPRENWVD